MPLASPRSPALLVLVVLAVPGMGCVDRAALRWSWLQAQRAMASAHYVQARDLAREVLAEDPERYEALELYAGATVRALGAAEALRQLEADAAQRPDAAGPAYAVAFVRVVAAQERQAGFEVEVAQLRRLVATFPAHGALHRLLGRALLGLGDFSGAIDALATALRQAPTYLQAADALVTVCAQRGEVARLASLRANLSPQGVRSLRLGALAHHRRIVRRGQALEKDGQTALALRLYQRHVPILDAAADECAGASLEGEVASALIKLRRYPAARKMAERAALRCARSGSARLAAARYERLSRLHKLMGDFAGAIAAAKEMEAYARKAGAPRLIAEALLAQAGDHGNLAQWTAAAVALAEARRQAREAGAPELLAEVERTLGSHALHRGDHPAALRHFRENLRLRRKLGAPKALASALSELARACSSSGEVEQAIALFNEALAAYRGTPVDHAAIFVNLGAAHRARGDHRAALGLYRRAADILHREPALQRFEAVAVANLGNVYRTLGHPEKALVYAERALALKKGLANEREVAESLMDVGQALVSLGRRPEAIERVREALRLYDKGQHDGHAAQTRVYLSSLLFGTGERAEVGTLLREAQAVQERLGDKAALRQTHVILAARALSAGDSAAADASLSRLETLEREVGPLLSGRTAYYRGLWHERRGALPAAVASLEQAARQVDAERGLLRSAELKSTFFAELRFVYQKLCELTLRTTRPGDGAGLGAAFDALERGKARGLLDLLRTQEARQSGHQGESALLARERQTELLLTGLQKVLIDAESEPNGALRASRVARLTKRRRALLEELDLVRAELHAANPLLDLQGARVRLPRFQQEILPANAAFLAYLVGDETTSLFVVTRERAVAYSLPLGHEALRARVAAYRTDYLSQPTLRRPRAFERAGLALHQALLGAVEPALLAGRDLVVSPDGPLALLPFEALVVAPAGAGARPTYLLERHALSYVPSASVMAALTERSMRRPSATSGLCAVGDPVYDLAGFRAGREEGPVDAEAAQEAAQQGVQQGAQQGAPQRARGALPRRRVMLGRLPATQHEVRSIAAVVGGEVTLLLRDEAREERIKAGALRGKRFVHFATHGVLDDNFQALALTLDPKSREDGFLELREIHGLQLDAELVTLSACQTGEGRLLSGEGVVGLTHAFLSAGAPRTVVSLWSVADDGAAELMVALYRRLGPPGAPAVARALREAKLTLLGRAAASPTPFALPYFWASFVAVGLP